MKKNIFYAFIMSIAMILTGCGSNDKVDYTLDDIGTNVYTVEAGKVTMTNLSFETILPFTKSVDKDVTVELSNFDLALTGCVIDTVTYTPSPLVLDGANGSSKSLTISGTVASDCNATGYSLSADKKVSLAGESTTNKEVLLFSTTLDAEGNPGSTTTPIDPTTPSVDGNYSFYNIPSVVEIKQAATITPFEIQVIDQKLKGAVNMSVTILAYDTNYGKIESQTVTTDTSGFAHFNYISPDSLAGINGQSYELTVIAEDANGTTIDTATITLLFNALSTTPNSYNLTNATPIKVTAAGETKQITVDLLDSDGSGISGKEVKITALPIAFGSVSPAIATTDEAGRATFNYIAPADISVIDGQSQNVNLLFTDENDNTITTGVSITIQTATSGATGYVLQNVNDVTVNYPTENKEIAVQLVQNDVPQPGKSVTAKSIPATFGRIENASMTTGADGYARFNYIAADTLTDGEQPIELVYLDSTGTEITITATIKVVQKPLYEFINSSNVTIEHGSQKEDLKAQLIYRGVPIAGKTVQMLAFTADKGTLLNGYSVNTDSIGYATFAYMAPETLKDVNNTTLNLTMQFDENTIHQEINATVLFSETIANIEGNVSLPIVVIPSELRNIVLNSNSKSIDIPIKVFKEITPYAQGTVKVELPNKILNGTDVGQFESYEVAVDSNGIATFKYTGPSNLQALLNNDDNESIFKFYHVENSVDKQEMKVIYEAPADPYVSRNYALDIITSGEFSMGIPDKEKTFNILLEANDAAGNSVSLSSEVITGILVSTENSSIAQILNTATGTLVDDLNLSAENNSPFILKSKKLSGLVPLRVLVEFTDVNGDPQTQSIIINVRVYSGPASAISISYVSTEQDTQRAKYIETLAISVTDEYGNRVNTRPNISLGAIVGYAVDGTEATGKESNETRRLFYGKNEVDNGLANGNIDTLGDADKSTTEFYDNIPTNVFQYVNAEGNNTDKLVVFGERKNYEAMGKWDISKIDNNTLALQDNYLGIDRSDLYYAVGHNYYQDLCRADGREWVGTTDSATYQLDEEGTVTVTYKYDYHLTGKDALIWVNLDGIQPDTDTKIRVGETVKHTLRGTGFAHIPTAGYSLKKGVSGVTVTFDIWHENAPERYRNGHFAWRVKEGSNCVIDTGTMISTNDYDARSCIGGDGHAFVQMDISNPDPDADCSFDITGVVVSSEF